MVMSWRILIPLMWNKMPNKMILVKENDNKDDENENKRDHGKGIEILKNKLMRNVLNFERSIEIYVP